jgi:hypothetical protein
MWVGDGAGFVEADLATFISKVGFDDDRPCVSFFVGVDDAAAYNNAFCILKRAKEIEELAFGKEVAFIESTAVAFRPIRDKFSFDGEARAF